MVNKLWKGKVTRLLCIFNKVWWKKKRKRNPCCVEEKHIWHQPQQHIIHCPGEEPDGTSRKVMMLKTLNKTHLNARYITKQNVSAMVVMWLCGCQCYRLMASSSTMLSGLKHHIVLFLFVFFPAKTDNWSFNLPASHGWYQWDNFIHITSKDSHNDLGPTLDKERTRPFVY